jgi:hypothetical protein
MMEIHAPLFLKPRLESCELIVLQIAFQVDDGVRAAVHTWRWFFDREFGWRVQKPCVQPVGRWFNFRVAAGEEKVIRSRYLFRGQAITQLRYTSGVWKLIFFYFFRFPSVTRLFYNWKSSFNFFFASLQ